MVGGSVRSALRFGLLFGSVCSSVWRECLTLLLWWFHIVKKWIRWLVSHCLTCLTDKYIYLSVRHVRQWDTSHLIHFFTMWNHQRRSVRHSRQTEEQTEPKSRPNRRADRTEPPTISNSFKCFLCFSLSIWKPLFFLFSLSIYFYHSLLIFK